MRKLVIDQIITNYEKGYDECNYRAVNGFKDIYAGGISLETSQKTYIVANAKSKEYDRQDLKNLIGALSDEELLEFLDGQACQRYR